LAFVFVLLIVVVFVFVLIVVGQANTKLVVEEAHVPEVTCSPAWVKLPSSERERVLGVEGESRIIAHIRWLDEPVAPNLVVMLAALALHRRHRRVAGVEKPTEL
jgi:hypothetical protein